MQYDEWLRTSMVLKFSEYISYIKIKKSGPSSWSLHEKKCILLSVMNSGNYQGVNVLSGKTTTKPPKSRSNYIKLKSSGPSSGSLHEKKCILLSLMTMSINVAVLNLVNNKEIIVIEQCCSAQSKQE